MPSSTISLDELLSSRLLDVPDYQRGYAWEDEQLREFWEDLDLIEPGRRHYTGTVVLRDRGGSLQDEDREVLLEHFDVVDGQQRLATCTLLLDRVYDRLEALQDGDVPSGRRRLLTAVIRGVRRTKLQLGPDLQEFWHQVILQGRPLVDGAPLAAQRRLSRAAEFVEERLEEAGARCADDSEYRMWLRRLAGKVTNALQFTLYVVADDSDVGVIFETLNQRGKELTELEKAKNYLLYLASLLDQGPRQKLTATINESWRTIFANLGSAQLGPAHEDQLLRAHWLATQNPRQREWEKIRSIKARFHRNKYRTSKALLFQEVTAYAHSLREASAAYRDIVTEGIESFAAYGTDAAEVRKRSRRLRQAGVVAIFAPLLIAARLRFPADGRAYGSVADLCERYSVRVFLINERRGNAGSTRLYSLAYQLHRGGDLSAVLGSVAERIKFFAGDEETAAELRNPRRNWYVKFGHKYFLYQYELHRLGGAAPVYGFEHFTHGEFKASTTEHILPQAPTSDCWLVFDPEDRALYTHCLGNLVLTNDNRVYSNYCFTRKRDGITDVSGKRSACYEISVLKQEQDLAAFSEWTPKQVRERQEMLAQWAMERWKVDPIQSVAPGAASAVDDEEVLDDDATDIDPMLEGSSEGVTDWNWDAYAADMGISEDRIDVARCIVDGLAAAVQAKQKPWKVRFRKGYVAFQRAGGLNVLLVDMYWNKPVRLAIKLPSAYTPQSLSLNNPFPQLDEIWIGYEHEWGWRVPSVSDIPDLDHIVDLADKYD